MLFPSESIMFFHQGGKGVFFVFNHVTKFCYVTRVRHAGGHPFSQIWLPRTRVRALVWLFRNITPVLPVQRRRDIVKRFLRVDLIHRC